MMLTKSYTYVLPMLSPYINIRRDQLVNAFIGDKDFPEYDNHIFLLYKFNGSKAFLQYEDYLEHSKLFVKTYDPDKNHVMYIFNVPSFYRNDYNLFRKGKYSEMAYDGYKPVSFLQAKGAKEIGVEFHSLSKTYNMTGWRIGFAVGNPEVLKLLSKVKSNCDSGIFQAIQYAGIKALKEGDQAVRDNMKIYEKRGEGRREKTRDGLQERLGPAGNEGERRNGPLLRGALVVTAEEPELVAIDRRQHVRGNGPVEVG